MKTVQAVTQLCRYPHSGVVPRASYCVEFRNPGTLEEYREHMCGVHFKAEHNDITKSRVSVEECPGGKHHSDLLNHEMARFAHSRRRRNA